MPWTAAEVMTLRRQYPEGNTREIAARLGRSYMAVQTKARELGIRKDRSNVRSRFLDGVMAEYANSKARDIAERRGVKVWTVRMWIREARYGSDNARAYG